jgi:hypothetical protein
MAEQPFVSDTTWMGLDRDAAHVAAGRSRWLVPVLLAAAAVLGWTLHGVVIPEREAQPPPVPVFAATDGLPPTLVVNRTYRATFRAAFPADWPRSENPTWLVVIGPPFARDRDGRATSTGPIYCTDASPTHPAGHTVSFTCKIIPRSPGPFVLYLVAGGLGLGIDDPNPPFAEYTHTATDAVDPTPAAPGR